MSLSVDSEDEQSKSIEDTKELVLCSSTNCICQSSIQFAMLFVAFCYYKYLQDVFTKQ